MLRMDVVKKYFRCKHESLLLIFTYECRVTDLL